MASAVAALALSVLPGCSTTNIEDVAPTASLAPQPLLPAPSGPGTVSQTSTAPEKIAAEKPAGDKKAKPAATVASADGAPIDTGSYPNINNVPKGETGQMTPEQRAALMQELASAKGEQQQAGSKPSGLTTVQQMQKLGSQHTKQALKTIVESE
ncbi:MAG: hypothetical protein KDJ74_17655, partial [Notoacmeibacter sp.]|nr:hypothetical protein [Notoacmeibacter sp.]